MPDSRELERGPAHASPSSHERLGDVEETDQRAQAQRVRFASIRSDRERDRHTEADDRYGEERGEEQPPRREEAECEARSSFENRAGKLGKLGF